MTLRPGGTLAGLRPWTSACVLLLFLVLPALVAGARLDRPARPGEAQRVQEALDPGTGSRVSPVARMYYGMTLPAAPSGDAMQSLALARRAQLLGVLGLSLLLYLSMRMVRSRPVAIAACLALALLPPVLEDGYVLRPETPAALFACLAVLLLQGLPQMARSRHRPWYLGLAYQLATMSSVGMCLALAVSALNTYTIYLLVPAATLLLAVILWGVRLPRVARRTGLAHMPVRAFALRLGPWVGTAFFTLFFSWLLFSSELGPSPVPQAGTATMAGVLPGPLLLRLPALVLAVLGALSLVLRTGVELGRTARLSPASVLLVFASILLVDRLLHGEGVDGLPAAPATAVLIAEGVRVVAVFAAPAASRRPSRRWP